MIDNPYKTLIILAGGSSIPTNLNTKNFDDKVVFGLNHWCRFYDPTALIWIDRHFYSDNKEQIESKKAIKITKAVNQGKNPANIIRIKHSNDFYGVEGLKKGVFKGELGGLIGLFALSLGVALNFKEIYLLGYDMAKVRDKTHFHNFNEHNETHHIRTYRQNLGYFDVYKNYKGIYNVSPESAIEIFPKIDYLEFTDRMKNKKPINQEQARKWLNFVLTKR